MIRAAEKRAGAVASFHCQVKTISRNDGRSATAAAAYRAGERIACEREGRTHDYTRKQGVEASFIHAPADAPDWVHDRSALWNQAEKAETRKNARVAREWEIALPAELSADQRHELADAYARALVDRYGAAVDVSIHAPHRHGDKRNYHAHVLVTTRKIGRDGFGEKTRVLDDRKTGPREVEATRKMWADMQNDRLERAGIDARVDHRSIKDQRAEALARGDQRAAELLDRPPETHMGPAVSGMERRAQKKAEQEGRPYEAVTDRGKAIQTVREVKTLLERLTAGLESVKERLQGRREGKEQKIRQQKNQSFMGRLKDKLTNKGENKAVEKEPAQRVAQQHKAQSKQREVDKGKSFEVSKREVAASVQGKEQEAARERLSKLNKTRDKPRNTRLKDRSNDWER